VRSDGFLADIVSPWRLQPVAIKLANKLVGWSPGSHYAPGRLPLLRFSSGNHWNCSPDMLWIILLIVPGLTPLLLPQSSGSWSLLPGSPALASSVLAPLYRIMLPLYSLSDLHSFNNRLPPDCMDILADTEILRKRHPPHRGSHRGTFFFHSTSPHSIPSIWSCRTPTLRHHSKPHVNLTNVRPLPRSTHPLPMQRHLRAALLNTRMNSLKTITWTFCI